MATRVGHIIPVYAAGDELEAVTLTETDRACEHDTYTPTLTASGGTPAIGADGFLTGWWSRVGLDMDVWIDISLAGVGVSLVGTSWRISLPYNVDLTRHSVGVLNAASDMVGAAVTWSATSADGRVCGVLVSAVKELIFYPNGSTASIGSGNFTTGARIKGHVRVKVAADQF
jgi:hypothetical protein